MAKKVDNTTHTVKVAQTSSQQATEPKSENEARSFIYFKESSNRLDAVNSIGCKGLGQDCNGQLEIQCPNWRIDRKCQDRFWDSYAIRRYGSWLNAYKFWIQKSWW